MDEDILYRKNFTVNGGDFDKAGEISTQIKATLKAMGMDNDVVRRVAIASFEAEMNVVIHADAGTVDFRVTPGAILITFNDRGPGIPDIELAMQEGYSTATDEMREKGFGAGMGLPNIKKSVDDLKIESTVGKGTTLEFKIRYHEK
jgi:serine/threonine-protein kinase RsbT